MVVEHLGCKVPRYLQLSLACKSQSDKSFIQRAPLLTSLRYIQTSDAAQSGSIGVRCTGAIGVGGPALQHSAKLCRHVKNLGSDRSFSAFFQHFQAFPASKSLRSGSHVAEKKNPSPIVPVFWKVVKDSYSVVTAHIFHLHGFCTFLFPTFF